MNETNTNPSAVTQHGPVRRLALGLKKLIGHTSQAVDQWRQWPWGTHPGIFTKKINVSSWPFSAQFADTQAHVQRGQAAGLKPASPIHLQHLEIAPCAGQADASPNGADLEQKGPLHGGEKATSSHVDQNI